MEDFPPALHGFFVPAFVLYFLQGDFGDKNNILVEKSSFYRFLCSFTPLFYP